MIYFLSVVSFLVVAMLLYSVCLFRHLPLPILVVDVASCYPLFLGGYFPVGHFLLVWVCPCAGRHIHTVGDLVFLLAREWFFCLPGICSRRLLIAVLSCSLGRV